VPHYKGREARLYELTTSERKTLIYESKSLDLSSDCDEAIAERELVKKNAVAPKSSGFQEG
jgi:hypothetical protein